MVYHDSNAPGLDPNAGVLRHFDMEGRLVGSAMPQSQFRPRVQGPCITAAHLVATGDLLDWYSFSSKGGDQYVEISTATMTVSTFPGLPQSLSRGGRAAGVTLTHAGEVSLSVGGRQPRQTYCVLVRSCDLAVATFTGAGNRGIQLRTSLDRE